MAYIRAEHPRPAAATDRAFAFWLGLRTGTARRVWLPSSLCEWRPDGRGGARITGPRWLLESRAGRDAVRAS